MSEDAKKPKAVRPIFLIAMGIALAGFGLISGMALDVATRPPERRPSFAMKAEPQQLQQPQPQSLAPLIEQVTNIRPERPSGEPTRAWAPDAPAGDRPMVAFAVRSQAPAGQPVVAIVIDDMGVDRTRSLRMVDLPGPLTLSVMTYADGVADLAGRARRAGHEVMAHLPMEPLDPKENPGRGALRVTMDAATIRATLAADLDPWSGYVGINNHMGSKFTGDRARMDIVMAELKTRGLLWLDSKTVPGSAGTAAARTAGVPFVERDVFIDNEQTVAAILAQLAEAEKIARTRGTAIAIGHPHDATLQALSQWLPEVAERGVALAPVTEILKRRSQPLQ
jgi:polysaccharide deacetylase 2 family uncharacterized protein YibQ